MPETSTLVKHIGQPPFLAADGFRYSSYQLLRGRFAVASLCLQSGVPSRFMAQKDLSAEDVAAFEKWAKEHDTATPPLTFGTGDDQAAA